jgi:hypothetical protein
MNTDNGLNQKYDANDLYSYQQFQDLLKQYIESDCWALQINDQYLFNNYLDHQRSIRENVEDQMIRDKIIENPHSNMLVYLHRLHTDCEIKIYMFIDSSLVIRILYHYNTKMYEIIL